MPPRVENDPSATELEAAFLNDDPGAVAVIAGWARQIASPRAWGFESVEDIVQATLLAVVTGLRAGRFDGDDLRAYVRRIAKNQCVSSYRRAVVRRSTISLEASGAALQVSAPTAADPERDAILASVLRHLEADCRRIIDLAYAQGLDRREVARRLGINVGAARVKLFRCLQRARELAAEGLA